MTETTAPKTNKDGRACGTWCIADHHDPEGNNIACFGPAHVVAGGRRSWPLGQAHAWQTTVHDTAGVAVYADLTSLYANTYNEAERLAKFLEAASAMTKAQLRALARQVRAAMADAYFEGDPNE
jgi:hypothetical protein